MSGSPEEVPSGTRPAIRSRLLPLQMPNVLVHGIDRPTASRSSSAEVTPRPRARPGPGRARGDRGPRSVIARTSTRVASPGQRSSRASMTQPRLPAAARAAADPLASLNYACPRGVGSGHSSGGRKPAGSDRVPGREGARYLLGRGGGLGPPLRLSVRMPARGLRPLPRPRADPPHRPRVRRGRGRAGRRGARPDQSFPYEIVRKLGALNLMGIPFPEEYGGAAPTRSPTRSRSRSSRAWTPRSRSRSARTPRSGRSRSTCSALRQQKREWLPRLCSGERLGAFGLTEPEAGSRRRQRAHARDASRRRVDRERREAVHHERRHRHLGLVRSPRSRGTYGDPTRPANGGAGKEISNLIVPNGTPGYEQGEPYRKMGWNASDTRPLTFSDCRVPEENLLGPRGRGSSSSCTSSTSAGSASPRWASGWRRARSTRP